MPNPILPIIAAIKIAPKVKKIVKKAKDSVSNETVEKFLKEHGFSKHEKGRGNKTPTDNYFVEEDSGKVTTYTRYSGRRPTFSRKTFDEPSFKALREWMGYYKGGKVKKREIYQEGGSLMMPPEMAAEPEPEMEMDMPIEEEEESIEEPVMDVPEDTYPNADAEEVEASQESDEVIEQDQIEMVLDQALDPEEQQYLMNALEGDEQLSQIFDKVLTTASEFSGEGEVEGLGDGTSDSIPARLSDGEFVMTQKATDQIGADNLQTMMDEAERAYDGGMMRKDLYGGGILSSIGTDDQDNNPRNTDEEIRKLMGLRANQAPSLR